MMTTSAAAPTRSTPFHLKPPSTQAGMLCASQKFQAWLRESYPIEWQDCASAADPRPATTAAAVVRAQCRVDSRRDLDQEPARTAWRSLLNEWVIFDTGYHQLATGGR